MIIEAPRGRCEICGSTITIGRGICSSCEKALGWPVSSLGVPQDATLDLTRYSVGMFPWEPCKNQIRLAAKNWMLCLFAVALVGLIILLALFRTPLPGCWEIGS
jgi:hypothetical protein